MTQRKKTEETELVTEDSCIIDGLDTKDEE